MLLVAAILTGLIGWKLIESVTAPHYVEPLIVNLFGPAQYDGAIKKQHVGPEWKFPGQALSASTQKFRFDLGYPPVKYARWLVIWTPGSKATSLRLVHMDDGPANITEIGIIEGTDHPRPTAEELIITDSINQLVSGHVAKQIGFQVKDGGDADWVIYSSRLEIQLMR